MSIVSQSDASSGLLQPFRNSRNFTALWAGQTLSRLGDSIFNVVLPITALSMNSSPMTLGILMMCLMIPQVILLPFTGILADRAHRVAIMVVSDSVRFTVLLTLAGLAFFHLLRPFELIVFAILFGAMEALFQPSYAGLRAQIFTPEIRNAANSLTQGSQQLTALLGPAVGGVIAGFASGAFGLLANSLGYVFSLVSLQFIKVERSNGIRGHEKMTPKMFIQDLSLGYLELKKHPWLWVTISVFSMINIGSTGIMSVLLPWLINKHLHMPAHDYGVIASSSAVGAIICSVFFGRHRTWRRRGWLAYGGILVSGISLGLFVFVHTLFFMMLIMAVNGAGLMLFGLIWEGSLQELVPTHAYGRVASLDMLGSFALMPIGFLVTGILAKQAGGLPTMALESILMIATSILTLCVPSIRNFD